MELYPKYEVSTEGRVRNSKTHYVYTQRLRKDGYLDMDIYYSGERKKMLVHRLVALCYLDNPQNLAEVNHKNKIKTDNRVENLEWVSREQNMSHRNQEEKIKKQMKESGKRLTELALKTMAKPVAQYDLEGNLIKIYPSLIQAEKGSGTNRKYIRACLKGERQTANNSIWKFIEGSTTIPGGSKTQAESV